MRCFSRMLNTPALVACVTAADIVMKSPGGGIPPYELSSVLGRATTRALHADDFLSYDVITAANPQLARK